MFFPGGNTHQRLRPRLRPSHNRHGHSGPPEQPERRAGAGRRAPAGPEGALCVAPCVSLPWPGCARWLRSQTSGRTADRPRRGSTGLAVAECALPAISRLRPHIARRRSHKNRGGEGTRSVLRPSRQDSGKFPADVTARVADSWPGGPAASRVPGGRQPGWRPVSAVDARSGQSRPRRSVTGPPLRRAGSTPAVPNP
jgi:hypothetical protein